MVIDSIWATVGSTNLDRRSFELNEELNLVVYDGGIARRLERVFEKDLGRVPPGHLRGMEEPRDSSTASSRSSRSRSGSALIADAD